MISNWSQFKLKFTEEKKAVIFSRNSAVTTWNSPKLPIKKITECFFFSSIFWGEFKGIHGESKRGETETHEEANGAFLEVIKEGIIESIEAGGELAGNDELSELLVIHIGELPRETPRPRQVVFHPAPDSGAGEDPVPHWRSKIIWRIRVRVWRERERKGGAFEGVQKGKKEGENIIQEKKK